jgi:choline dehydrogenase-like flavoprotein
MIATLRDDDRAERSVDVLVIGAGPVGLVTAVTMAQRGLSVLCLESGGMQQDADEHPLNEVIHTGLHYDGAAHGRFRCLGGTSTRWGGAMIPLQHADVEHADWPIAHDDIVRFLPDVEALSGGDGRGRRPAASVPPRQHHSPGDVGAAQPRRGQSDHDAVPAGVPLHGAADAAFAVAVTGSQAAGRPRRSGSIIGTLRQ